MKTTGAIIVASVFLMGLVEPVSAQIAPPPVEQIQLDRANPNQDVRANPPANVAVNERQAVALAQQQFEGQILRISLIGQGPTRRYQIRMENEGKVFTVFVHATTGNVTGGN
ncbi:MAG: PepSY domain-containing protein [Gammaproteobacteria bacterium]